MGLIILIVVLVVLFGGVGFHSGWGYYGAGPYGGVGALIVLILLVWLITGGRF